MSDRFDVTPGVHTLGAECFVGGITGAPEIAGGRITVFTTG